MDNSVFYYINGEPLNGKWIDLEYIDSIDEVLDELADSNIISRDEDGNIDYDGDLLVADTEGELAKEFYRGCGSFDLDGFIDVRDSGIDQDVASAYLSLFECWDSANCRNYYYGYFDSLANFVEEYIETRRLLAGISEPMRCFFDLERYGKELLIQDFCEKNGYFFYNH